ncbi:MAG: hypothetical protein SGILL_010384 [Bacillariaceae sp.]
MGACLATNRHLREVIAKNREDIAKNDALNDYSYWSTMGDVWNTQYVELSDFSGKDLATLCRFRHARCPKHYRKLLRKFGALPRSDSSIENSVFHDESIIMEDDVVVEVVAEAMPVEDVAREEEEERKDTAGDKPHRHNHCLTLNGRDVQFNQSSRAHNWPKTPKCSAFYEPFLPAVLGPAAYAVTDRQGLMKDVCATYTNMLVWGGEHNHFYDDLDYAITSGIPLKRSLRDVFDWQYKDPYEILFLSSNKKGYEALRINGKEAHVKEATDADLETATNLVKEMMQFLATSLLENFADYERKFDAGDLDAGRFLMMKNMRNKLLRDGHLRVPEIKRDLLEKNGLRLYKVDYEILFSGPNQLESRKYIPDPFPALMKGAINVSAFFHDITLKLLPAGKTISSEESDEDSFASTSTPDFVDRLHDDNSVASEITIDEAFGADTV